MIEDLYNTSMDVYSYSVVGKNTYGGVNRVLVLRLEGIECYETELTEEEVYRYGRQNIIADHLIFCAPLSVCATDKFFCYGTNAWYDINFIDECDDMESEHHFEILCRTIRAPEIYNYSSSSESTEDEESSSSTGVSTSSRSTSSSSSE